MGIKHYLLVALLLIWIEDMEELTTDYNFTQILYWGKPCIDADSMGKKQNKNPCTFNNNMH